MKKKQPQIPADFDPVFSVATVRAMLADTHEDTLQAWVKAGKLPPPVRLSEKTHGWRRSTIEQFIAAREAESAGAA
jgi:predicted DNA-binding transcriptional regulator AlpA